MIAGRALVAMVAAIAVAGCGSSASTSTTQGLIGGPPVECDRASLDKAVVTVAQSRDTTASLTGFKCSKGWAVVNAEVGPQATPEVLIFEAEGQFWIPKDAAKVCPSPSPVPADLRAAACPGT